MGKLFSALEHDVQTAICKVKANIILDVPMGTSMFSIVKSNA
jgi:hypothetical protein